MAYAALVSLEQTIDQILNQDRYTTSPHDKQQIISLDKYVISLQAFLEDFPEKANNLEGRIRDAATAAEDIIECFMLDQTRSSFGCIMWIDRLARIKFKYELNKVAEKMDLIAAEMVEIKNSIIIKDEQLSDSSTARSSSGIGKMDLVGFDDDLMEIKGRLIGESPKLQFLSIVGMGGIGKTTLAKNAYDNQLIREHFQIRAWVTVSQDYRAREILSSLLDSMKEFDPKRSKHRNESMSEIFEESIEEMADRVYKILKCRRYVVVMDDMWSTKVLDDVRKLFPDDVNGSRIMLTTRLSDVAAYVDSSIPPYEIRLLNEDQSWNLFRHKVFAHQDRASPKLETIGKEIARSCRGLPLAVVVIAGVVSIISRTPASWGEIAKNIKSAASASKDDRLERILSFSYNHLPHRLRPCLLYMGAFPEDYRIRVSELIKLWIAEGFLKHPNGSKTSLEEGAEEYLEDLVQRNLILVTEKKADGKIKSCSLHDMVRDTCIRLLEEEKNLRHVRENTKYPPGCISMRSILQFDGIQGPLEHCRLLRVLHVPKFMCTPQRIMKLLHLRYLAIKCHEIPSAISNFQNLQTIVINDTFNVELPRSIWKMRQLRHLIFRGRLPYPEGASSCALENLRTFKEVHDQDYRTFLLGRLPNLRKLGVYYSRAYFSGGRLPLVYLRQLETLRIRFAVGSRRFLDAGIPASLKKCTLYGCRLSRRFLKTVGWLPNLEVLKLTFCSLHPSSWVIGGGEFPQLKFLLLDLLEITSFITEDSSSAFPRLNCLLLNRCFNLIEISHDIGEIPALQLIEVKDCEIPVYEWATRIEEEQQSYGNDTLQILKRVKTTNYIPVVINVLETILVGYENMKLFGGQSI